MKKIAIVGAGFSGLALVWHFLNTLPFANHSSITLFDAKGIGGGSSGIAAGLLHPFSGAHAKLNRFGFEGMAATRELLDVVAQTLGKPVTSSPQGIFRPAIDAQQFHDFKLCVNNHPTETKWLDTGVEALHDHKQGLWINEGLAVDSKLYLKGLWQACQQKGAQLVIEKIDDLDELKDYDFVVLASGYGTKAFEKTDTSLSFNKGQILELKWPADVSIIPYPINSQGYIVMTPDKSACHVGASFERTFSHKYPDLDVAKELILSKIKPLIPELVYAEILGCQAGIRVSTPTHLPLIKQLNEKVWILTGMGSKGLLYHALFAKKLVDQVSLSLI